MRPISLDKNDVVIVAPEHCAEASYEPKTARPTADDDKLCFHRMRSCPLGL